MGRKTNREVWFLAQTHWYIRRNPITWSNEVFTFQRLFVIKGENKRDLTCGFGRSSSQAHHKGRQGARRGFRLHLWSEIPKPSGTRVPRPSHSVFVCICIYMNLFVFFVCVFLFYILCLNRTWESQGRVLCLALSGPGEGSPYLAIMPHSLMP